MIIKSLELHNFRQFMDDEEGNGQKIVFSIDPERKATLLIAKNATGKTTLLQSFAWVFYGEATGLKSIINIDMIDDMVSGEQRRIEGIVVVEYLGRDYVIDRYAMAQKSNIKVALGNSTLKISYTDEDGNNKELLGYDANNLVQEIVPKDLFPYFFFQGENIESIGKEIASGKVSGKSEFVRAIRGMLGFNWLYNEQADLKAVIKSYQSDIADNSNDKKIIEIQNQINKAEANIEKFTSELNELRDSVEIYKRERERIIEEILKSGDVAEKQREAISLDVKIKEAIDVLNKNKKEMFSSFSAYGYRLLAQRLIEESIQFLKENGNDVNKGVPGMEARAIQFVLEGCFNEGECFCGQSINSLPEKCRTQLETLKKYLPPNNLGENIKVFENTAKLRHQGGEEFQRNHQQEVEDIVAGENNISELRQKKKQIDEAIKGFPDMRKKKDQERKLNQEISKTEQLIGSRINLIDQNKKNLDSYIKEKEKYRSIDERVIRFTEYEKQAKKLYDRLVEFCERKEKEKKNQLQNAINEIFRSVFDVNITMELDDNYNMRLRSDKNSDLLDFQNSTSQDAILAFAFIGGIIRLAREKVVADAQERVADEDLSNILDVEPYPLVMDAPSSSFDTDRIESFCRVMPSIAEQVVFFIKDTDGNYVKENLKHIIGKEYSMEKTGQYRAVIREVR